MSVGNRKDSAVFRDIPFRVMKVLGVTRPQAPTTQVMEVDENRNVVTLEVDPSSGFTTIHGSFCHRPVRFFEGEPSMRRTSMKR